MISEKSQPWPRLSWGRVSVLGLIFALLGMSASLAVAPRRVHRFAQIGDGGGLRTVILVSNPNDEAAQVKVNFFDSPGQPLAISVSSSSQTSVTVVVPAGGAGRIVTDGQLATPVQGWAELRSEVPVVAQVLFEIRQDGKLVTQAAVESVDPRVLFGLFVDRNSITRTGVAIANPRIGPTRVRSILKDEQGNVLETTERILPSRGKLSRFVSELFTNIGDFKGTLRVESSSPVIIIGLQQTDLVLGTLSPVISFR